MHKNTLEYIISRSKGSSFSRSHSILYQTSKWCHVWVHFSNLSYARDSALFALPTAS